MITKTTWEWISPNYQLSVLKIPNSFSPASLEVTGNMTEGKMSIKSEHKTDNIWGADAKLSIEWSPINPMVYHHGLQVKKSIDLYAAINVVVTNKTNSWHLSHDLTIWRGKRQKMEQRRMYAADIIHGIVMCDQTNRLIEIHADIEHNQFLSYEKSILNLIKSIQCHPI